MNVLRNAIRITVLAVFTAPSFAQPLLQTPSQGVSPTNLEGHGLVLDSELQAASSAQQTSPSELFNTNNTDLLSTDSAFVTDDSSGTGLFFSDQFTDNQALIINVSE
jgi:hypothetical protein